MMLNARAQLIAVGGLAALVALLPACGANETAPESPDRPTLAPDPAAEPAQVAAVEPTVEPEPAAEPAAEPEPSGEHLLTAEMTAYDGARAVFEEHCAACHMPKPGKKPSKKAKEALMHFSMESYPFGGHHADELPATIRKVLGATGEKPTMPKDDPGAVAGAQLDAVLAWATAYDAAHAAKVGHHAGHDAGMHGGGDHGKMHGDHGDKPKAGEHDHGNKPKTDKHDH